MRFLHVFIAMAAALAMFGCASERHVIDVKHPEVRITDLETLEFKDEPIDPADLPGALRKAGYAPEDTISILIPSDIQDFRFPYYVMGILSQNGYRRPVLVKERRSYSVTGSKARDAATPGDRSVDGRLKTQTPGSTRVIYPAKRQQTFRRK